MTFDLDKAVREWIQGLKSSRALEAGDLAEFETHVHDEVEDLIREGRNPEEAFRSVIGSVEGLDLLDSEFVKSRAARGPKPAGALRGILPALAWNSLRVGLRRFRRHRVHAVVNLASLALGLAASLFIVLYVRFELSYDRHNKNADRIFRVVYSDYTGTPYRLAAGLRDIIPEIEQTTAVKRAESEFGSNRLTIAVDGQPFEEGGCFFADRTFFSVFDARFLGGAPDRTLNHPRAAVLTRSAAERYFGTTECLGRTLLVNGTLAFQVEAVVEDPPSNTHFPYTVLLPTDSGPDVEDFDDRTSWGSWNYILYLLLKQNTAPRSVQAKLPWGFPEKYWVSRAGSGMDPANLKLQGLTDIHLRSRLRGEIQPNGDIRWVVFFSAVGLLILGSALLNYLNLATAQSLRRSREVGMRKILGARRGQLARQFLGEAVLLTALAAILGLGLLRLALPALGPTLGTSLRWEDLSALGTAAILAGLVLVAGLIAGSYPAIFASAFDPVRTLKGIQAAEPRRHRVKNGLILFQFVISLGFGTAALIILGQLHFLRTKDLGMHHEEIVSISLPSSLSGKVDILKRELLGYPGILAASGSDFVMEDSSYQTFSWEGQKEGDDDMLRWFFVDADFVRTFGLKIAEGRDFQAGEEAGRDKLYIINRAAAARFGWTNPVGKRLEVEPFGRPGRVVGVVEDFNFRSLHYPVESVAFLLSPPEFSLSTKSGSSYQVVPFRTIFLRVSLEKLPAVLRFIDNFAKAYRNEGQITWSFLDEEIARLYARETKTGRLLAWLAAVAAVLAGLGVFGLSSYMVESRLKEVSIRRVLGAGGGWIMALFAHDFLRLVLWAAILSFPLVFWRVSKWLGNFAFRIEAGPGFFAAGLASMILLVLGAVGWPLLRTARGHPSRHLRSE